MRSITERLRPGAEREPVLAAWGFTVEGRRVLLHLMAGSKEDTQAPSRAIARDLAAGVVADYSRQHDSAVACFMDDFEACIAHPRLPVMHRWPIRTTNLLERLFVEERRRLKIIPNAFGERAVLKLMFGALIRAAERWKSIKVSEFECVGPRP
jgi:transposase-like protein